MLPSHNFNIMEQVPVELDKLLELVDWRYIIIFILLASTIKKAFGALLQKVTKFEWLPVYTVLILATVLAIPWALLTDASWLEILVSYAIGTSFYETILERIINKIIG